MRASTWVICASLVAQGLIRMVRQQLITLSVEDTATYCLEAIHNDTTYYYDVVEGVCYDSA